MGSTDRTQTQLAPCVRVLRWLWPGWWLYAWYVGRFVRHDCQTNRVICRLDWLMETHWIGAWLDV